MPENKIGEIPKLKYVEEDISILNFGEKIEKIDSIIEHIERGSFVYWQAFDRVDFGYFDGKNIILNDCVVDFNLLQELRIFSTEYELHIWKQLGKFIGRVRRKHTKIANDESETALSNCLIQKVKLWGSIAEDKENFVLIKEDRGMSLSLPIPFRDEYRVGINVYLEEYRYIEEDDKGCIYFCDRRFSSIFVEEKGNLLEVICNGKLY